MLRAKPDRYTTAILGAFAWVALSLVACTEQAVNIEKDSAVTAQLLAWSQTGPQGTTHALDNLDGVDFDTLSYFLDGTPKPEIEKVVGSPMFGGDTDRYFGIGPLLVFTKDKVVTLAVVAIPPLFVEGDGNRAYRRNNTALRHHTKDPGPYQLMLIDIDPDAN